MGSLYAQVCGGGTATTLDKKAVEECIDCTTTYQIDK
ncbi:hypothetical protein F441_07456 [Phytophthora nicotianae CJ01A1]|nr:hypothetical protein F443_07469 [Phytophthora nicotianae P1569]ETP18295.1 hypothetical protein F441_07456 [Phytophthora nicotianae CJ01A1]ETP46234.1 hypothetical protein F442_07486 [Phytophthora nicotianae P10297]